MDYNKMRNGFPPGRAIVFIAAWSLLWFFLAVGFPYFILLMHLPSELLRDGGKGISFDEIIAYNGVGWTIGSIKYILPMSSVGSLISYVIVTNHRRKHLTLGVFWALFWYLYVMWFVWTSNSLPSGVQSFFGTLLTILCLIAGVQLGVIVWAVSFLPILRPPKNSSS